MSAPSLSVLLFERPGWDEHAYREWSTRLAHEGALLCVPTRWQGRMVLRLAFVNPATEADAGGRTAGHAGLTQRGGRAKVERMNPAPAGRPLVAVPARFSTTASALRYEADAVARRLLDAILAAGGEPLMVHPSAPGGQADDAEVASRLAFADALLLPGGADISPSWYGRPDHPTQYGVNLEQDAFDLAAFRAAVAAGIPILAICRGAQLVNIASGGTLVQDMDDRTRPTLPPHAATGHCATARRGGDRHHRNRMHHVTPQAGSRVAVTCGASFEVSCFHHQAIDRIGAGLR